MCALKMMLVSRTDMPINTHTHTYTPPHTHIHTYILQTHTYTHMHTHTHTREARKEVFRERAGILIREDYFLEPRSRDSAFIK